MHDSRVTTIGACDRALVRSPHPDARDSSRPRAFAETTNKSGGTHVALRRISAFRMKQVINVYLICAFSAIGGGLFGFDISSMAGVIGEKVYEDYFGVNGGTVQGAITAAMPAGSLAGALSSSFIADRLSRKASIQIASLFWILGSIVQATSNGIPSLVIGRIISGICVGIASAMVPVYQAEIAPKEIRGRIVTLQQWAITWGIFIQYFIQYGSSKLGPGPYSPDQTTWAFRIPWAVQCLPAALLLVGLFFMPNTPRWLASQDRWEEAIKVLASLHSKGDINSPKVLAEYQEIEEVLRYERRAAKTSFAILTEPRMARRVAIGMAMQMWSQLSGINVMMYYTVYIMQSLGNTDPFLSSSVNYVLNVACTIPALIWLDSWGRRPTMLIGSVVMGTFLMIVGALEGIYGQPYSGPLPISWQIPPDHPEISKVVVAFAYLTVCTYATTWGPVSWTYPSEVFPNKIRAKAVSLSTATNWAWNCALAFGVPPLLMSINWRMFVLFGTFNFCAFITMFFVAPETKGVPLEEMDEIFAKGRRPWKKYDRVHRVDILAEDIKAGKLKISMPVQGTATETTFQDLATVHPERKETPQTGHDSWQESV